MLEEIERQRETNKMIQLFFIDDTITQYIGPEGTRWHKQNDSTLFFIDDTVTQYIGREGARWHGGDASSVG